MRFLTTRRQRMGLALVAALAAFLTTGVAFAYFTGTLASGSNASAGAQSLPQGNTPTVMLSGANATVTWSQNTVGGQLLGTYSGGGYRITRYPAAGGSGVTPVASCNTTIGGSTSSLSCTETGVPAGSWTYTVTPVLNSWVGIESAKSGTVSTGTIGLSPSSGHVGDTVAITGSNFPASSAITATYDGAALTLSPASPTTDGSGNASVSFTVPASTAGNHTVQLTAGGQSASAAFSVSPKIAVSPTSGVAGTTDTITGTGFAPSTSISATFGGSSVALTGGSTNASGSFTATYTVPNQSPGAHTVMASDGAGDSATATYTISTPAITLTANSGHVGDSVTVSGSGFPASSTLTATYGGAAVTLSGTTTTDSSGNVPAGVTFTVPASAKGAHTVAVTAAGQSASASFTVSPQITLTPTTGYSGTSDAIAGTGFTASSSITATFGGSSVSLSGTAATNTSGSFTGTSYSVPSRTAGTYTVTVSDSGAPAGTANASYTIIAPSITLGETSGHVGDTVSISGSTFPASSAITATYAGSPLVLGGTTTTDGSGNIPSNVTFSVPPSVQGGHTVQVTAGGQSATATFTVTPQITLSPDSGSTAGASSDSISGTGFPASTALSATFGSNPVTLGVTTSTDGTGSFSGANYTVPSNPTVGPNLVTVTAGGQNASTDFYVFSETSVANASNSANLSMNVQALNFSVAANATYLILVARNSSTGDSITSVNVTGALGSPTLVASQTFPIGTAYQWAYYATGTATGTASVTASFHNALPKNGEESDLDIVSLAGDSVSNPIATGNVGTANGTAATATANLPSAPAAGDAEDAFLFSPGSLGPHAPVPSPAMSNLFYGNDSTGAVGVWWAAPAVQNESIPAGNPWGTITLEIRHP